MAFLAGILAKESVLGVLAALYGTVGSSMLAAASGASAAGFSASTLASQIPPAEAIAFLFAVTFNIPCVMTIGATHSETHSTKWTVLISLFYFAFALLASFVVYHVAVLIV